MNNKSPWFLLLLVLLMIVALPANAAKYEVPEIAAENLFPVVVLETSAGTIKVELNRGRAPETANNFLRYVTEGFYNGTVFHRVMPEFVVQGGGYNEKLEERGPLHAVIINESGNGLGNDSYTIAMARENPPHTANSQFYFNLVDNDKLNPSPKRWGYAVFGLVIEGEEIIDKIAMVKTHTDEDTGFENVPVKPVYLYKAFLVPAEE
ncbi:MAG: peptidylprolyl isomerase [Xanthomonadales bacterium]|nr:peptidylprolyl isomerase [Xanthomonadales bacterium]